MRALCGVVLILGSTLSASVVIDRVAVVVGRAVIKESDLYRDLRVTDFLNRQPLEFSPSARRKAADRLIDQRIIREEIQRGAYAPASHSDVDKMIQQIRQQRFGGSDVSFRQHLARYGLTESQLREQLEWQLDVLSFIEQRFRPGVQVSDEEVTTYYDQNRAALQRAYPGIKTFAGMEPKVRARLEEERLNDQFDRWLKRQRTEQRIEFHEGAFQ